MFLANLQDNLFKASIRNKKYVIGFFVTLYSLIILSTLAGAYPIFTKQESGLFFYSLAVWYGRAALFMLSLTVLPGIFGRFRIKIPLSYVITRYRRQFGILVFLLAFAHYSVVNLFPQLSGMYPFILFPQYTFMQSGFVALCLLLLLFLTSNQWSVLNLKKWWKRLHRVIYVILWLVFLHVFLQNKTSFWTVWIGIIAVLEVLSLIYYYLIKKGK